MHNDSDCPFKEKAEKLDQITLRGTRPVTADWIREQTKLLLGSEQENKKLKELNQLLQDGQGELELKWKKDKEIVKKIRKVCDSNQTIEMPYFGIIAKVILVEKIKELLAGTKEDSS